jgi:uncharacterized protein (TIGR00251 family)
MMKEYLRQTRSGVEVLIRLAPRAAKNRIGGEHNGRLKVSVTSPPVDGKANKHLIKLLSARLKVARTNLSIVAGETSRDKTILVNDLDLKTIEKRLG